MSQRPFTRVRDVMTSEPQIVERLASVREAIDRMREHNVSSLVIDRRQEGDE